MSSPPYAFLLFVILSSVFCYTANGVRCYECEISTKTLVTEGGNCIEPSSTTGTSDDDCDYCKLWTFKDQEYISIKRTCENNVPQGQTIGDKCILGQNTECTCNGILCNNNKIDLPSFVFDCYQCTGSYKSNGDFDDKHSCFKPDTQTPTRKYCSQCFEKLTNSTKLGTFSIDRNCQQSVFKTDGWTNETSADEKKFYNYCRNSNLCNNLDVESLVKGAGFTTAPEGTTTKGELGDQSTQGSSGWSQEKLASIPVMSILVFCSMINIKYW